LKKVLIGLGALILVIAAIGSACSGDTSAPSAAAPAKEQASKPKKERKPAAKPNAAKPAAKKAPAITPEMVVDLIIAENPGAAADFCQSLTMVGDGEMTFQAFKQGYGEGPPSAPARAVFDEFVSRC
jgi:hypothetical protein